MGSALRWILARGCLYTRAMSLPDSAESEPRDRRPDAPQATSDSTPRAKPKRNLLAFTLAGLPELQHFRTDEERQAALQEIGGEAGNPKRGSFWLAVGMIVASVIAARMLSAWVLSYVVWPGAIEELLRFAAIFGTFLVVLRRLHRWGAVGELRAKLLARSVPVCMKCGYLLHGLPVEVGRCPECGREFDADVQRILRAAGAPSPT